jgi:hypothetical protein
MDLPALLALSRLLPDLDAPEVDLRAGLLEVTRLVMAHVPLPLDAEFDAPPPPPSERRPVDLKVVYPLSELVARMHNEHLSDPRFVLAIASSKCTGKTRMLCEITRALRQSGLIEFVTVISAIPHNSALDFGDLADKVLLYEKGVAMTVYETVREIFEKGTKVPRHLVIFDDVGGTSIDKDAGLVALCTRGRQYLFSTIVSSQMPNTVLTPTFKAMADYTLFGSLDADGLKVISKGFNYFPLLTPLKFSEWVRSSIAGPVGLPHRFVFGVYDKQNQQLFKMKV